MPRRAQASIGTPWGWKPSNLGMKCLMLWNVPQWSMHVVEDIRVDTFAAAVCFLPLLPFGICAKMRLKLRKTSATSIKARSRLRAGLPEQGGQLILPTTPQQDIRQEDLGHHLSVHISEIGSTWTSAAAACISQGTMWKTLAAGAEVKGLRPSPLRVGARK